MSRLRFLQKIYRKSRKSKDETNEKSEQKAKANEETSKKDKGLDGPTNDQQDMQNGETVHKQAQDQDGLAVKWTGQSGRQKNKICCGVLPTYFF